MRLIKFGSLFVVMVLLSISNARAACEQNPELAGACAETQQAEATPISEDDKLILAEEGEKGSDGGLTKVRDILLEAGEI